MAMEVKGVDNVAQDLAEAEDVHEDEHASAHTGE